MKCARKGCNNIVPPEKRKYCSEECCRLQNQERTNQLRRKNMSSKPVSKRLRYQKVRICLGCDAKFPSSGPWNRLCQACTQKNTARRVRTFAVPRRWIGSQNYDSRDF